jgi:hypothetical protein
MMYKYALGIFGYLCMPNGYIFVKMLKLILSCELNPVHVHFVLKLLYLD